MPATTIIIGSATIWNYKDTEATAMDSVFYNSRLYPYYYYDTVDIKPAVVSKTGTTQPQDTLDIAPSVTNILWQTVVAYVDLIMPPDTLDIRPELLGIVITGSEPVITITYDLVDILDIEPAIDSIVLTDWDLIIYTAPPDDVIDIRPAVASIVINE